MTNSRLHGLRVWLVMVAA